MRRCSYVLFLTVIAFNALAIANPPPINDLGLLPGDSAVLPAVNSQQEHSIARGGDHYLAAWSDYRGRSAGSQSVQGDGDVLGIRLNAQGQPIDATPFVIAGGMGLQNRPLVAWNGSNWLVVYISQDPVGGYYENRMRAVRVSPSGEVLDATPIVFPPTQYTPNTVGLQVAGLAGQWLVTRCIYHDSGYGTYLAGQRIDDSGQLLDPAPIMLMDWIYGQARTVVVNGEYLVVGPDWTTASTIRARRVGQNAAPIGAEFSLPSLSLTGGTTESYVVWIRDYVNLVGSRVSATGALLTPNGTMIVPNISSYNEFSLAHDGTQWWLEWGAADQLQTIRIDANGTVLDPNGGVQLPISIGGTINHAYSPQMVSRPGGGVHLLWYDSRVAMGYDANVFLLPISAGNAAGSELCISTGTTSQRNPDFAEGPGGSTAVVFVSESANDDRVLVHRLGAGGPAMDSEPIEVFRGPTVGKAGIAWNGSMFLVVWDQGVSGQSTTQIKMRRLWGDGSFVDAQPLDVMTGFNPDVGALGEDFLVVGGRFGINPQYIALWGMRVDGPTGERLDGTQGVVLGGNYVSGQARVRQDGTNWLVAAHSMWTHDSPQSDALLVRVPPFGPPQAAFNPTPISGGSADLDIAYSGSKYLLVWRMNSLANANNYIAGRIMNADGTFPPGYFTVAEAPGRQLRPCVAWDGTQFLVAWEDQRNQESFFDARTDVYGARVSEVGVLLDPNGFAIQASAEGDATPAIISRMRGAALLASASFVTESPFDSYRIGITLVGQSMVQGDMNGDNRVDLADCDGFVQTALGNDQSQQAIVHGDMNSDGVVNGLDVKLFVMALMGG